LTPENLETANILKRKIKSATNAIQELAKMEKYEYWGSVDLNELDNMPAIRQQVYELVMLQLQIYMNQLENL
jgi:hypothetical protein